MNVPTPVIPPRTSGLPRPVSSPVSERPSENAIEMPAPIEVARPATNGVEGLVARDRDREDRRERRERAVDQPDHRRLDALEQEILVLGRDRSVGHTRVYRTNCK